ncbi:MAG: tyrosine-type recombinase/integrase [Gaiellaceae bacterium]
MFKLFKRRTRQVELSLLELSSEGYCRVVGESHYQEALKATVSSCSLSDDGRRTFTAALVREPNNPYDVNAVGIWSPTGKVGHLAERDQLVLLALVTTGLRRSELCALEWRDLELDGRKRSLLVRHGKSDKSRSQPIPARLARAPRR